MTAMSCQATSSIFSRQQLSEGLFCVLAGKYFYSLAKRRAVDFNKFELSEEDKKTIEAIYDYIERSVTKKDLLLHDAFMQTDDTQHKGMKFFIKKYNGKSFKQFIMKSRVEIAKERLRSSRCKPTAVADSCGFKNVEEMAKYFRNSAYDPFALPS